ncbi:Nuclear RNA export factor 1 [Myotis brandtii]|uniref:Nuclear RNA export factor 1 n=2 Tax=Myotis brandtii TaxID=109478 RepID=S7NX57_MYOBR|nr:Nuclear RNA export factor 1 [Myotis brandtii]
MGGNFQDHLQQYLDLFHLLTGWSQFFLELDEAGARVKEHDDRVSFPQRRKKGRGPFRWKCEGSRRSGRGGAGVRTPRLEDDDRDVAMSDAQDVPRVRYTPYAARPNRRVDNWHDRDRIHVTVRRDRVPPQRGGAGNSQDGTSKNWFKITIPYGRKYDKAWLLSMIQSKCSVPFTPIEFHYENTRAQFFVEDASTASALKAINYKISDQENRRISIIINSSPPPLTVQNELKPEQVEQLKLIMSKRYDGSQQALDLKGLRLDPDLVAQNIDVVLNRKSCMAATLRIIEENIPELLSLNLSSNKLYRLDDMSSIVQKAPNLKILNLSANELKSERELDKIKGLKLEELWLEGNTLCDTFRDQSTYISAIRERFPKLLRLDGHELPPPIAFDVEAPTMLPPCKGSYFGTETLKTLVLHFLQQYYAIYDSGNRQRLLDAYHDGACCSLSIPFTPQNPARSNLGEYFKDSRNVKKLKDPTLRFRLLKHTRLNVVAFLNELPKTQHDINSFVVDISAQTNTLLCFSVNGVFKEVDGKSRDSLRAFTRTFVAVPASNSGLCIVNDELFVRNASPDEIQRAFAMPAPTPSSSPVPTLSPEQQEMLQAFSTQSGMNLEWSQKCLQDNNWDYTRSAQAFTHLKAKGEIPEVAFMK